MKLYIGFISIRYLKVVENSHKEKVPTFCSPVFALRFFFKTHQTEIMVHNELVLYVSLHTVIRRSLCRWLTRYVVSEAPGQAWPPSSPLRSSCSRSRGARLAEKHTSPVARHNYFHMFVPPGRSKEQSPLFWKQTTLISETKIEAFRNSAGYLDRCFSLESFKCIEVSKRLATNTHNYAGLIRLTVVRYCLLKMYALKMFWFQTYANMRTLPNGGIW